MALSVDFAIQAYNNLDPKGQEEFARWIAKQHGTPKPKEIKTRKKRRARTDQEMQQEIKATIEKLYGIRM